MRTRLSSKIALVLGSISVLVVSAVACSESDDKASGFGDASVSRSDATALGSDADPPPYPDAGTVLGPCDPGSVEHPCPANFVCVYPIIEGCGAQAVCVAEPAYQCNQLLLGCGCDGGPAYLPCELSGPNGYATAPVTGTAGEEQGADGGIIGPCIPFDVAVAPDAGDAGDSGP